MTILILEGCLLAILTGIPLIAVAIPTLVVLATMSFLLLHTAYRISDRRRIILLSKTRGACLDARFGKDSIITVSNHGRLIKDTSAPALRASFATWVLNLPDWQLNIKAQNKAVAAIYIAQFPDLLPHAADMLGRVSLTIQQSPEISNPATTRHD